MATKEGKVDGPKLTACEKAVQLTQHYCELWHTPDNQACVTVKATTKHYGVASKEFGSWLKNEIIKIDGKFSQIGIEQALIRLERIALDDGDCYRWSCRVERDPDAVWVDLGSDVVRIDTNGYKVQACPANIKFHRTNNMALLPEPIANGTLEPLRLLLNLPASDWLRFLGAILDAFKGRGPYLVTQVGGEQGSGKSLLCSMFRRLVDPVHKGGLSALPKSERDLGVECHNNFVLAYDNVSWLDKWLSDALCRVSTGAGIKTRKLYSDSEEQIFDFCRPIITNGIVEYVTAEDLQSRATVVRRPNIETFMTVADIWARFDEMRPAVLGAIFTMIAKGLGFVGASPTTRMADTEAWLEGCMGDDFASWKNAMEECRQDADEVSLQSNIAAANFIEWWEQHQNEGKVVDIMEQWQLGNNGTWRDKTWTGTMADLRKNAFQYCDSSNRHEFPKTPRAFGNSFTRAMMPLKRAGFNIVRRKSDGKKIIEIDRVQDRVQASQTGSQGY